MSSADVRDPQALLDFRTALVRFHKTCDSSLGGHATELARVKDLLRGDYAPYWKRQVAQREEAYQAARRAWLEAAGDIRDAENRRGAAGKQSAIDERIAMDKARRRREEAEEKVVQVGRSVLHLEREGETLIAQCSAHQLALSELLVRATARLDQMHERLMDYLAAASPSYTPPAPSSGAPPPPQAASEAPAPPPAAPDAVAASEGGIAPTTPPGTR